MPALGSHDHSEEGIAGVKNGDERPGALRLTPAFPRQEILSAL